MNAGDPRDEGRPAGRPFRVRAILAVSLLALAAAPLYVHFAGRDGIAAVGDDSVSYLLLARFFAGAAGPLLAPWVGFQTHFPPLFPLALAAFGAASNPALAHLLVALFAVAALVVVQRYGALRLGDERAGLALAAAFLLTPTAWVSAKAILSEPMFLFVSLVALHAHARLLEGRTGRAGSSLVFGLLLAATALTRAAGIALAAAFVLGWASRAVGARERPRIAPLVLALAPLVACELLWIVLRPSAGADGYARTGGSMVAAWMRDPVLMLTFGSRAFLDGWFASFGGDAALPLGPRLVFAALGAVALAGSVRAARMHRLDGWYALVSVAMTLGWVFGEDNMRRLLYPVVPVLLLHAAEAIGVAARRAGRRGRWIAGAALALPALLCVPAVALVQEKSFDDALVAGSPRRSYADVTAYYTTVNRSLAKAVAAREIAVLDGLESLDRLTPPGARVLWMRPEYVALLGRREGVAYEYRWDPARLAEEIRRSQAGYVVSSTLFKTDLDGVRGDPSATLAGIDRYTHPVFAARNAVTGAEEFVLLEVDRAAVDRALAAR